MTGLILIYICIIIAMVLIIFYNMLVNLRNRVKQSKSTIDVYLAKRFDLIPNLVEVVKGYAKHEQKVFQEVMSLRQNYNETKDLETAKKLNKECNELLMLSEEYPALKSSENFLKLQVEIEDVEDEIQAARRVYNSNVTVYNTKIESFPVNIFAFLFKFKEERLFEIEKIKTDNISVDL